MIELAFLSPLFSRPGPWASAYFDTTRATEDAARQQELRARGIRDRLAAQGADEATCDALYLALAALPPEPGHPGRALFATEGEVVLDVPLAAPPPPSPSLSCWAALPRIAPMVEFGRQEPTCLVAYVDRKGADLQLRRERATTAAGQVTGRDWPTHRTASSDWSERHFQLAVENTWEENAARIADTLASDMARTGAEVLVLAGDARERRSVHDRLPSPLREAATETGHGGRAEGAKSQPLEEDIAAAREEYLHSRESETLDRFRAGLAPAGGAIESVQGLPALVGAAQEHRIAELLFRPGGEGLEREVWVGREPDQLALRRADAEALGGRDAEPEPVKARADDALLRAAVATGAEVVPVPPGEDIPAGGLGALLRWGYEPRERERNEGSGGG
ncbi:baeRF2 domain-containing protein [Streptomyces sp. 6N223]|uniref:baeRF2 domain-containing protein n=1 Tax=Streptomyces sp. 6N223 TaxID=3457412 RepID=UPI003FD11C9A